MNVNYRQTLMLVAALCYAAEETDLLELDLGEPAATPDEMYDLANAILHARKRETQAATG